MLHYGERTLLAKCIALVQSSNLFFLGGDALGTFELGVRGMVVAILALFQKNLIYM